MDQTSPFTVKTHNADTVEDHRGGRRSHQHGSGLVWYHTTIPPYHHSYPTIACLMLRNCTFLVFRQLVNSLRSQHSRLGRAAAVTCGGTTPWTKPGHPRASKSTLTVTPHHDLGGQEAFFGPINVDKTSGSAKDLQSWEQQCHSLFVVLATKQLVTTDQLRAAIEGLTAKQYHTWTYYEKWSAAMATLLLQANVVTHAELSKALFGDAYSEGNHNQPPRFAVNDKVRVKEYATAVEWQRPHIRTPGYVYGVAGRVERYTGRFPDPSFLAFAWTQSPAVPSQHLYRVKFRMRDLWPEQCLESDNNDLVEVELYEHWLEPSEVAHGHAYEGHQLFDHQQNGDDCIHDSEHHHHHHHHHGDHLHEARPLVEQRAVDREGPPRPGKQLHQALMKILVEKDIVSVNEVRLVMEKLDTAGKQLDGASLVVEAWMDPSFRERLLANPSAAAQEIGIVTSNPNAPTVLSVVPNTPTTHNLVVCTLCSCYPSGLLGIAPSWYKSSEFRSRAVREPRRVLEEDFGLDVSHKATLRVHDSTADHRYIVLPERPAGTEGWSKEDLRALITRDTMIGVAVPMV